MIEFQNISVKVHRQILLKDTGLQIAAQEKVVLRGPSGCGKSSLLKCAAGLMALDSGTIRIDGLVLSAETVSEIRGRLAFIGQEPVLGAETVREALLLPFRFKAHSHSRPKQNRVISLLERLHLSHTILDKPCQRISGGEKQRIAIARALLLGKTVFLADEATSALDPDSKSAVMDELFRPEITLLSVSHDPDWMSACGRIVDIQNAALQEINREKAQETQRKTGMSSMRSLEVNNNNGEDHDG